MNQSTPRPSLALSFVPVLFLIALLVINVILFKDDATGGPNQLALLIAGAFTIALGAFVLKVPYQHMEDHIVESIRRAIQACLILLVVGALIGTWIQSGIVPTMIYYGLKIIEPTWFLPVACLSCALVSVSTGSSWSTSGTLGIALIGIGHTLGIPIGMVAGAVISGAYFGDKMSPLSDTTNLAPAMAGTDLFTHIRHMVYTSGPAILISLVAFTIIGLFYQGATMESGDVQATLQLMESKFNIGLHLFLAPLMVLVLVGLRTPAFPALILGALIGGVFSVLFQAEHLSGGGALTMTQAYMEVIKVAHSGFHIETGNTLIDSLFSRGGMSSMLSTVWLILMAMIFGGTMEATGMLDRLAGAILSMVHGAGSLIGSVLGTCLLMNMTACDQYLAIVVPGRMYKKAFDDYGLHPKNLSRSLEDAGTVTSVLIPWNSGGAYHSSVLGVPTLTYLPYCFFNILSPLVSLFLASMDWTIERMVVEDSQREDGPVA
jgi:Na+:H+ antiporter, NhaC family